jgi:hypothetical protein
MKRVILMVIALAVAVFVPVALGDSAPVTPFPSVHSGDIFVIAQTVQADGAIKSYYAPGATVFFRAYAVDGKTHKLLTGNAVKYFYVTVPNQPNVKMKYAPTSTLASGRYQWTGSWVVPANYPLGTVYFKVLVKNNAKRIGTFVQMPVATSQLTISATPPTVPGNGPGSLSAPSGAVKLGLYVDTVNGTAPAGTAPRPIGCTQTNVFKRGERVVVRSWGFDLTNGSVLTMDNVTDAHFTVTGQPNVIFNWGAHGAVGYKVWFWSNFWIIPADYPLGDVTIHASFTTAGGTSGTFDYPITVIPA